MRAAVEPLVSIRGLEVEAAGEAGVARMLRGVDLDIGRGRIVGVVGESGSGKSTLAAAIIGLLPANVTRVAGEIRFGGGDLLALGAEGMRELRGDRVAMIFQDPMTVLNPVFTIGTQMTDMVRRKFPELDRREALTKAEAMLARVGIPDPDSRIAAYPHQLSGGMRQRVMIAMALLTDAELILADEPTTALDATVEAQIVNLFQGLQRELSGSVLFISHHLGLLAEFSDDVAVMYGGMVVETGPMAEVAVHPGHPYTAALLACEIDDDPGDRPLVTIPGAPPSPLERPQGCLFAPRCPLVIEPCRAAVPPMIESRPGVFARCIRTHDV
jgi:peptide/nickel transport system ATP-binding protein